MSEWVQKQVVLREYPRGIHLITREVIAGIPELSQFGVGLLNVFLQHTSASIAINEAASPDVRTDLDHFMDELVPDAYPDFEHKYEGPDDMPAHVKTVIIGNSLSIPVAAGRIVLGEWQGIYLGEHRNRGGKRKLILTLSGKHV